MENWTDIKDELPPYNVAIEFQYANSDVIQHGARAWEEIEFGSGVGLIIWNDALFNRDLEKRLSKSVVRWRYVKD